jgi:hypothetical protein
MLRRFLLLIISAVSASITTACGHRPVDDPLFSKISMQALVDKSSQGRLECPSEAHIGASAGQLWGGTGAQRVEADTSCKVNRRAEPPFEEAKFMSALGTELQQRITSAGGQLIRFRPEDKGFAVDYVDGQHQGHIRISGKLMSQDWYSLQMVMEQS